MKKNVKLEKIKSTFLLTASLLELVVPPAAPAGAPLAGRIIYHLLLSEKM